MSTKIPIESIEAEVARRERDEWHGRGGMTHGIAFMQGVRWAEQQHVVPEFVHEVIQVHLDTHDGRTHSEKCYRRHADCLARLVRDCIEEWGTDGERTEMAGEDTPTYGRGICGGFVRYQ